MSKAVPHLYTLGYEGMNIDSFVARLADVGVRTVVDVRELPLSRKKGFSKSAFRLVLSEAGIAYAHLPVLGCPRPIRDRYKVDGDWDAYTRDFKKYLASQGEAVEHLARLAGGSMACLVCFESDYTMCHRTYVARAARQRGGPEVRHLTARTALSDSMTLVAA
jgi:uncharacterized protein (DUF488 family)